MNVVAAALAVLSLGLALPASAQSWGSYGRGYGYDYNGQADRPGDYRCDAYWDRGRDDCDAAWRDQRPFANRYSSYGHGRSGYDHRRYTSYGHGYGQPPAQAYYGAYGRPDLVYPSGGYGAPRYEPGYGGQYSGGRDPNRTAYCAARYRSYDPGSGYYRAYSGRLVFCG